MPSQGAIIALAAVNALAFLLFGLDKGLSKSGRRRVPEAHLILLGGLGAGVGAWLAMSLFRHKTRKRGFQLLLGLATAAGIAGWGWWMFGSGIADVGLRMWDHARAGL